MNLGYCGWWKCRNRLGILVYRLSKLSRPQFCSKECCEKWHQVQERQHTFEPKLVRNREDGLLPFRL